MKVKYNFYCECIWLHWWESEILEFDEELTEEELNNKCREWAIDTASFGYTYQKI
jgi:hypothetical protein